MPAYASIKKIVDVAERNRIVEKLLALRAQLNRDIPAKTATDTLLLATWNIREFGDNRLAESLYYIAEIISRFDLIAVQEVAANLDGLRNLVALLGPGCDYIVTDSTDGSAGGGERMAFIYDRHKVFFRKMAGELVLPEKNLLGEGLQFARTPFSVAFQAGWFRFILTTVHILYGTASKEDPRRVAEINAVAEFLNKRAKKEKEKESYILLGDFNIFGQGDATMKALETHKFYIPDAIKEHPTDLDKTKYYDQIALKLEIDTNMTVFAEGKQRAGAFDYTETIYLPQDVECYQRYFADQYVNGKTQQQIEKYYITNWRTFQMSDHLPLWIELKIDFSDQYLARIKSKVT
ncbi:MAG: endonuclease/exonuclease/phosphatase family protein [Firmicutes bacterium]|nr:endonuclease/exonuclease/phosphatase family protein [Bacillota bacterium]